MLLFLFSIGSEANKNVPFSLHNLVVNVRNHDEASQLNDIRNIYRYLCQ